MSSKYITFDADAEGFRMLAIFLAQLEREGVTYSIGQDSVGIEITLTGGY